MVMSCTCQASMNNCALYCNCIVLILHLQCIILLCLQIGFSFLLPGLVTLWWRFQRYISNCIHIISKCIACRLVLDLTGFVEQQRGLKPLFRYVSANANRMAHKNKGLFLLNCNYKKFILATHKKICNEFKIKPSCSLV